MGCDAVRGFCNPNCCCCWFRCSADDAEEPPTSAVVPKEETKPIAANKNTSMEAAIEKCIGRRMECSFMVKSGNRRCQDFVERYYLFHRNIYFFCRTTPIPMILLPDQVCLFHWWNESCHVVVLWQYWFSKQNLIESDLSSRLHQRLILAEKKSSEWVPMGGVRFFD